MPFKNLDRNIKNNIIVFTISGMLIVLFYLICNNLPVIGAVISEIMTALMPFILGIFLTLILVPLRKLIEKYLSFTKWNERRKRMLATALSVLILFAVIVGFFAIIIPQLINSAYAFASNINNYINEIRELFGHLNVNNPEISEYILGMIDSAGSYLTEWFTGEEGGLATIVSYSVSIVKNIANFLIGAVIAFYLLLDEEKIKRQVKKFLFGLFNLELAENIMYVGRLSGKMFNRFISGKALDSLIIGIVTWIFVTIFRMPYAPLIAFIIGVTNMIPVFGPFIGAVPCLAILVIINPVQAFEFLIFIIILQQVDGNIIGPRILGDSLGLPTIWVMFAIIVGGALFGIVGMFLGVPIFSVIYSIMKDLISLQIIVKRINVDEM